ncbi:MAG: CapA family protein [Patescibacteria group bacterium]|jgi:poly-gamma-glutamate synthesis protein (capsule biosynthesis protein)
MSKIFLKVTAILVLLTVVYVILLSFLTPPPLVHSPLSSDPRSPTNPPSPTPTPATVTVGLLGDLGLGRHITSTARQKDDFSWSFQEATSWLSQNDFNLANLESPVIKDCPHGPTGTFTFCGDTRFLPHLKSNKFYFNLSNNHILNYGNDGLRQTKDYLNQNEIPFVYSHSPDTEFITRTINGITFGFLGYDFVTYPQYDRNTVLDKARLYDNQVDWLVVSLHWGNEYLPSPESWRQNFAKELIDAGVDIIHGHHPHVWQEPEVYKDKLIYYSFGNFIFDQSWSYETSHSQIARLTLTKDKVLAQELYPIEIVANSQPRLMSP